MAELEQLPRGKMVSHRLLTGKRKTGRVLGHVATFNVPARTWVVVQWEGGLVACSRPKWLETLREANPT